MNLRLAFVGACPYPVPQGSQVLLRDTALAMKARGHDVHLVVYGHGLGEDTSGLTIHRCRRLPGDTRTDAGPSWVKPFLDLALAATLRRVVVEQHIDVVHVHNYEALLVALLARTRPIVYHAHNAMIDELPHYFHGRAYARHFGRWLDNHVPKRADWVVAPHRRIAGYLVLRGCVHGCVSIVPPPVDLSLFEASRPSNTHPHVLYAGNLDPYQNMPLLYEAVHRLRLRLPEVELRVATAQAIDVPVDAKRIFTPDVASLAALLAEDCVVAVPRVSWSGYPIKILNAMAAGRAVVACESAAYPIEHMHNGLVVPDNDPEAFANALHTLLTNARWRAELGRHARDTILQHHTFEKVAEQFESIASRVMPITYDRMPVPTPPPLPEPRPELETKEPTAEEPTEEVPNGEELL